MRWVLNLFGAIYVWLCPVPAVIPYCIAVIPNGNRRLAKLMQLSLSESYILGAKRALDLLAWAEAAGVTHVVLFGLSCENFAKRTREELDALIEGANRFLDECIACGYRLHIFGDLEGLAQDPRFTQFVERLKSLPKIDPLADAFTVHIAANYSGNILHEMEPLYEAIAHCGIEEVRRNPMRYLLSAGVPNVDLIIRTGARRESRTSGLLPFQSGYAEIKFLKVFWGDFSEWHFRRCLRWYSRQRRNFGK